LFSGRHGASKVKKFQATIVASIRPNKRDSEKYGFEGPVPPDPSYGMTAALWALVTNLGENKFHDFTLFAANRYFINPFEF
jgi:hypothetical protein